MAKKHTHSQILLTFGKTVKKFRQKLKVSQEALAYDVGIHRTYMSSLERGERNVAILNIVRIAKALKVMPSELFSDLDKSARN